MKKSDLNFVLNVLQEKKSAKVPPQTDWYNVLGFLELHRISGPFYHAAKKLNITLPQQVLRKLKSVIYVQAQRNQKLHMYASKLSDGLREREIKHAFLKGSILNNAYLYYDGLVSPHAYLREGNEYGIKAKIYEPGDRISNDIDILIAPESITQTDKVLKELGFTQGYWDFYKDNIVPLSRHEIISRRMNRGETAPYLQKSETAVLPFIEIDVNFSLDYLPTGNEDLSSVMLDSIRHHSNGLHSMSILFFFIHLLLHQYKEMTVLSMVKRNKDTELYKYLDIYKIVKAGLIEWQRFLATIRKYGIETECLSVLKNTTEIFDTLKIDLPDGAQSFVIDPENNNKKYGWTKPIRERLLYFNSARFLSGGGGE
jgi:hypothetical protein